MMEIRSKVYGCRLCKKAYKIFADNMKNSATTRVITFEEVFYMATKGGGEFFGT